MFAPVPPGFSLVHQASVGSTNTLAKEVPGDRLFIVADEQIAGRGRRERGWTSPPGNLYCSLRLEEPSEPAVAANLSFVAAVALADAISVVAPVAAARLALKWPNDTLVDGAKAAGILVEGVHAASRFAAIVGCGVNVASHPPDTLYPATHLAVTDPAVTPSRLFEAYATAMATRLADWDRGRGFATIRAAWLARSAGLGQTITVRLPGETLSGRFEALDVEGRLVLRSASGVRHVAAGDVFFA